MYGYCEVSVNMDQGNGSPEFYSDIRFQFPLSQYYEKFANICYILGFWCNDIYISLSLSQDWKST